MTISSLRAATLGLYGGITPAQVALLGLLSTLDRQVAQCAMASFSRDVFAIESAVSDVTECAAAVLADGVSATCAVATDRMTDAAAVAADMVAEEDAVVGVDAWEVTAAIETC